MAQSNYNTEVLADSPAGFWKMDEASGNPQDSSGNGKHMTALSGIGTVVYEEAGPFSGSKSIRYIGSGSPALHHDGPNTLTVTDNFTIELWVKGALDDCGGITTGGVNLACRSRSTANGMNLFANTTVVGGDIPHGDSVNGYWIHAAWIRRSGTWESYLNGSLFLTSGTATPSAHSLTYLGGTPTFNAQVTSLSNVAVYNSALSAARILAHYAAAMDYGKSVELFPIMATSWI